MSNVPYYIVIPARLNSTRLPNKVLLNIAGKPLIQHVYEQAKKSNAKGIYIASDSDEILNCAKSFGANIVKTADAENGTARIAQAVNILDLNDDDIIVNLQGDVPYIPAEYLNNIAKNLSLNKDASIATLVKKISKDDLNNKNIVKAILNHNNQAIYFTREAVATSWHHVGVYGYRTSFLRKYSSLNLCEMEVVERLEQLRAIYYGYKISASFIEDKIPHDINTKEDLEQFISEFY